MDLGHDINGRVASRPEHETIGGRGGRRIRNGDEGQALASIRFEGFWIEDPEFGETGEFFAGRRSDANSQRAGGDAINLPLADGAEIRAALNDSEFIPDAGLTRLRDRAPA